MRAIQINEIVDGFTDDAVKGELFKLDDAREWAYSYAEAIGGYATAETARKAAVALVRVAAWRNLIPRAFFVESGGCVLGAGESGRIAIQNAKAWEKERGESLDDRALVVEVYNEAATVILAAIESGDDIVIAAEKAVSMADSGDKYETEVGLFNG